MKNPLFTISKRGEIKKKKSIMIRIIAGVLALIFCSILSALLTNKSPITFFIQIFNGNFGTIRKVWNLLQEIAILLLISLAVTPAFKMKFWNIGAEGQVLVSGLACAACMFLIKDSLNPVLLILVMFICSVVSGIIWTVIPAIFKAFFNTNETLFTLMMNYIAMCLVSFFITVWVKTGSGVLGELQFGHLPALFGQSFLITIIVVAVITAILSVYLKKSKHGYEITVVGESINTARYVGINVKKTIIRTMILSGAICGIAGFLLVSGYSHTVHSNLVGGKGFTAILVSWLAHFEPLYMIITSFLVSFINRGSAEMASVARLGNSYPNIMTGIFFLFIISSEFFINYRINFHKREKKDKEVVSC